MKKIFSIIGLVKTLFFIFLLFANLLQAQDWIKDYQGIPIESELIWDWVTRPNGLPGNRGAVDSMHLAGVDIVRLQLADPDKMVTMHNWKTTGFRVFPFKSADQQGNQFNWIQHYCDAKYSVWEAEGSSLGIDDAALKRKDPTKTEIYSFGNSTLVRRIDSVANSVDQLTEGPYYVQDVHYYASQEGDCRDVQYKATFSLMLQNNTPAVPYNPSDIICVLQVTYSKNDSPTSLDTTIIIEERILRRNDFDNLNIIDTISIDYSLANTIALESSGNTPNPQYTFKADLGCPGLRDDRKYIEFKVIWKGNSNANGKPGYLLSFDKVVVSDERGRELKDPLSPAVQRIKDQDESLITYEEDIPGWIGIDEPESIDIFEPIRIVKEVLQTTTNSKRPLRIPFMGFWDGVWESINNPFGTNHLSPHKEFFMRTNGLVNIWQNS
ncbi:MAG: hypothetical protein KBE38_14835, partial [Ignavibacterium sp.]|nr:hypothetical protein [Ignavibacterium sp.]